MKNKLFRTIVSFSLIILFFSCEDQSRVANPNPHNYTISIIEDSNSPYSGSVVDQYGEAVGAYKKGLKDGQWEEKNFEKGTQKVANYIMGVPNTR